MEGWRRGDSVARCAGERLRGARAISLLCISRVAEAAASSPPWRRNGVAVGNLLEEKTRHGIAEGGSDLNADDAMCRIRLADALVAGGRALLAWR